MKNRMLSKRVYFTVSALMMLVLFMFQFSGIIRKKYNNFDENKYAVSEKNDLNNNNVFTVLTDEDKVVKSISGYIVYIGDINTKTGNTVYEWCNYTKRNLLVYKTVSQYHRYNEKYPDAVLIDSDYVNIDSDIDTFSLLTDYGINLVFCTLPSYSAISENQRFEQLCGISPHRESVNASGLKLYSGFLFGGEAWYTKENDPDGKFQNMKLTMPWYNTSNATKTYMSAVVESEDGSKIDNEDQPAVIWRKSHDHAYVFCINGDYIKDISGMGILTAIMSESKDLDIYPVVDSQSVIVNNFPMFSFENDDAVEKYYLRNTSSLLENVIWPDISNLAESTGARFTFMAAPQINYSDNNLVSVREMDYFFRLFSEISSEAGLTTTRDDATSIDEKLTADAGIFSNYLSNYKFTSIIARKDELENVLSSKNSLIDDVNTIVTDSQDYGGTKLFSYVNDNVINVECPVTSDKYTYSDDFRQRCFQTALAYTNIEFNMTGVCNPDDEKELWNEEIKSKSTALTSYMKNSKMFTKCSISQADKRIREFMAADYSYKQNSSYVSLDITGAQDTTRFIVRLRTGEVENVSGAVCTKVEKGVYLITAQSKHVEMTIKTE
ncbi:DUF2194 domain-containing protein [Lachnospira hominis (ex Hitch et al. 2024)]|uniref:DUF2194 domain-containing protein n=1 Tax=Lachnospira intestinalis TaxID=3133158 RepID=A0ABV1GL37_9FIRM